eukprot:scaffold593_cov382-Prasinococcus_capsulatus_cf.AAC.16
MVGWSKNRCVLCAAVVKPPLIRGTWNASSVRAHSARQDRGSGAADCMIQGSLSYLPAEDHAEWQSIEGPFSIVWVKNCKWDAENVKCAPHAELDDGCLDILIVRSVC